MRCLSRQGDSLSIAPAQTILSSLITLYLGSIGMDCVISDLCYKGKFYRGIIHGHFSIIPLQNAMVKQFGSHNMGMLYPILCYKEVFCKGIALYQIVCVCSFYVQ